MALLVIETQQTRGYCSEKWLPVSKVNGEKLFPPPYPGALKELLVVAVELKRLLEVQVGGGQRDGEVDSAHVGQDGVL